MTLSHIALPTGLLELHCLAAHAESRDPGRDTLPANDGWAAEGTGTTGGAAADSAHVHTVTDRAGLVRALAVHNAYTSGSERDLTADVGRTPTLHTKIDSAEAADREVARGAGAGRTP